MERIIARGEAPDVQALVGINYGVATRGDKGALVFEYPAYAKPGDHARLLPLEAQRFSDRVYLEVVEPRPQCVLDLGEMNAFAEESGTVDVDFHTHLESPGCLVR